MRNYTDFIENKNEEFNWGFLKKDKTPDLYICQRKLRHL